MKRFTALGVAICAIGVPLAAEAAEVIPVGWTADGNVVVEVIDPLQSGQYEWAEEVGESFFAVCTPAAFESAQWDKGCTVCIPDAEASDVGPDACGLTGKKFGPKLRAQAASPNKKVKLSNKRACQAGEYDKVCTTSITVWGFGTVSHEDGNPNKKAKVTAFFRKDSGAVMLDVEETSASDSSIKLHSFLVVDLSAGVAEAAKGGGGTFVKKWTKLTDRICACKNLQCVANLQAEVDEMVAAAEVEGPNLSEPDQRKVQTTAKRAEGCINKLTQ